MPPARVPSAIPLRAAWPARVGLVQDREREDTRRDRDRMGVPSRLLRARAETVREPREREMRAHDHPLRRYRTRLRRLRAPRDMCTSGVLARRRLAGRWAHWIGRAMTSSPEPGPLDRDHGVGRPAATGTSAPAGTSPPQD